MNILLFDFEKIELNEDEKKESKLTDQEINEKYAQGDARIVTEQGTIKLPQVNSIFESGRYIKKPIYQRRITWDVKKRSKLIESFLMNIPVPPIFIYEVEFDKYEVMDGLQRISAIEDFYNNRYALEGLTEWPELNGRNYVNLPQKVREGIDRRQISVVSLLKESTKTLSQEQKMKRMVFERLNTGGVKLEEQEIRNALYDGVFNDMCKKLSENDLFRKMWGIPNNDELEESIRFMGEMDGMDSLDVTDELAKNGLYMRMYDVELVLRFFAMRHLSEFSGTLSEFLDKCLLWGNNLLLNDESNKKAKFERLFDTTIQKAYTLFGDKAFCLYKESRGNYRWSKPQKMIYDALMLAVSQFKLEESFRVNYESVREYMEKKYADNCDIFNGKKQARKDIEDRTEFFSHVIADILEGKIYE